MRRLLFVTFVGVAGCYPAERGKLLETKLERLEADNAELVRDIKQAQERLAVTLPTMDQKIAEVTRALESLDKASRRSGADTSVQLQKTIEDVAALRGQLETALHKVQELEAALATSREESERKLAELKGEEEKRAAEARRRAEELKRPEDKKEFLALAEKKAKAGEVALARELYAEFLKKWGKDPLAASAHFGLGESFYGEGKCREALFEYGKVIQEHPKSDEAPGAYLHSSDCFQKLKMGQEAKLALEEIVKSYTKSEAAVAAKAKLSAKAAPSPARKKK
jgi:TolA-binding protein